MDTNFTPYAIDTVRTTTVFLHTGGVSLLAVRNGTSVGYELTTMVTRCTQTQNEVSVTLMWHLELYDPAYQPKPGHVIEIKCEGVQFFIGHVQAVNDYHVETGTKQMVVVARTRDATPAWREVKRVTDIYPVATPLQYIAQQLVGSVGVDATEFLLPQMSIVTVHSSTQMADLSIWDMLTTMLQPVGLQPYIDTRGRLKAISRDTTRLPEYIIDNERLVSVNGSKSTNNITAVQIKWLDPKLTEVSQVGKKLGDAVITAGFFQLKQEKDILFSDDGTQRARDTYLVVRQSANSGLLNFCDESYEQLLQTKGRITVTTSAWAPALATAAIAAMLATSYVPDGVAISVTVPAGRVIHDVAEAAIMVIMMSIGTGVYEIWGTPYDYVHARNKTEAYNQNAAIWEENIAVIENDFVMDEPMAQAFAVREMIYSYRSASSYGLQVVDDLRVEVGDIFQLADGSRVYVTGYTRDLTTGTPAVLQIQGFRA